MADFLDREEQGFDALQSNAEILKQEEDRKAAELELKLSQEAQAIDTESGVQSGEKAGPTLEPSRKEKAQQFKNDNSQEFPVLGPAVQGVADTAMDTLGMIGSLIPWMSPLKSLDDSYDANFGRDTEKDPAKKLVRDISATVIPSLTIGGAVASGMKAASAGVMLSSRTHLLGRIAAEAGVGTAITAISEQTDEQENLATYMYDLTGVEIPWRHIDGDSPYWTFSKNMVEDAFFNIGGAAL